MELVKFAMQDSLRFLLGTFVIILRPACTFLCENELSEVFCDL